MVKIKKTHLKTENNFTIYETVQHNECVICSKLIMSQFLSSLDVRKRVLGCVILLDYRFYTSLNKNRPTPVPSSCFKGC